MSCIELLEQNGFATQCSGLGTAFKWPKKEYYIEWNDDVQNSING